MHLANKIELQEKIQLGLQNLAELKRHGQINQIGGQTAHHGHAATSKDKKGATL
jgi:hypothetical protein